MTNELFVKIAHEMFEPPNVYFDMSNVGFSSIWGDLLESKSNEWVKIIESQLFGNYGQMKGVGRK